GQAKERVGASKRSVLYTQDSIRSRWNSGFIASPLIGPSVGWHSLHWRLRSLDASPGDTSVLKVIGIRHDGARDTLLTVDQSSLDVTALETVIDAATYPYVQLVAYMRDVTHRTSPQLKSWNILFDEAPECALNPAMLTTEPKDSLQEGEKVTYVFPIENIGARNFNDSLVVTYSIEDAQRNMVPLTERKKSAPFVPGQVLIDTVQVDSYQLLGNNALW